MAFTAIWLVPFSAGSGTTIVPSVGTPSIQSFGSAGGWYPNTDGKGYGYKCQYNSAPNATGSDLITGVHNATRIATCFIFRTGSTAPVNGEVLISINADDDSSAQRRWTAYYNGGEIRLMFNNAEVLTGTTGTTLSANTLYRLWIVADTSNATAGLRFRMYLDGAAISATVATVTQNTAITITTSYDECVCGAPFGAGTIANAGYSHYIGFWTFDTFDEAALLAADAILADDNDLATDPFESEEPEDITGTGAISFDLTVAGVGTFTITGTAAPSTSADASATGSLSITGTAATSSLVEVVGSGTVSITGTGAPSVGADASGAGALSLTGSGAAAVGVTVAGTSEPSITGDASAEVSADASGAGSLSVAGSGAPSVDASAAGSGTFTVTGVVAVDVQTSADAVAAFAMTGQAAAELPELVIAARTAELPGIRVLVWPVENEVRAALWPEETSLIVLVQPDRSV